MAYANTAELPVSLRKRLPRHAQEIYRAAFNEAFARYGAEREATAHRIAWGAVKRDYYQAAAGIWVPRKKAS